MCAPFWRIPRLPFRARRGRAAETGARRLVTLIWKGCGVGREIHQIDDLGAHGTEHPRNGDVIELCRERFPRGKAFADGCADGQCRVHHNQPTKAVRHLHRQSQAEDTAPVLTNQRDIVEVEFFYQLYQ